VVTSNGTTAGSAVVWEAYSAGNPGTNGALEAFNAVPQNGILKQIWSSPFTATISGKSYPVLASKFAVPATDDGRVYVGTRGDTNGTSPGYVFGYGVKSDQPFTGTGPVAFADAGVGGHTSTATVTLTATEDLTINGASLSTTANPSPFSMGTPAVNGTPVTSLAGTSLTPNQKLTVPLTFTPASTGGFTGSLQVAIADAAGTATATVQVSGQGTNPGLSADPATLAFGAPGSGNGNDPNYGPVAIGTTEPIQTAVTNTSTSPMQVTGIALAGTSQAAFKVTAPALPFTLTPGQSQVLTVSYRPTAVAPAASPNTATMTISNGTSQTATVHLTGVSVKGQGVLTPSTTSLVNFGHVPLGTAGSTTVTFTNTGNLPVTVTGFTAPTVPFGTPTPIATGLAIAPGDKIGLPITYTPQGGGTSYGSYKLTTTDGHNPASTLTVNVAGIEAPPPGTTAGLQGPGGGWTLNGSAAMKGTTLDLTQAAVNQAGSAVYYQPMNSNGLTATFTEQSSGGTGGDGLTFALVSPGSTLGGRGAALGYGGLKGIAVVVGTRKDPGFPSANFVGIATGTSGGNLTFAATSSSVPNLRSGTHVIAVSVASGKVTVKVDGKQYLSASVTIPAQVVPAFTAGTGAAYDLHAISKVSITSGVGFVPPPGGGWSYNGSAIMAGSDTDLTLAKYNQAGTVIYPRAIATSSTSTMTAQFQVQIGGGNGANGATFALLNPATAASAVGTGGAGYGLQGLGGMAVVLSTYPELGTASHNFIAVVTSKAGASGTLTLSSMARVPVGQLRSGIHTVTVTLANGSLAVYLDGGIVATAHASGLGATSLPAFTASTGGLADIHAIRDVSLTASAW
jgi:hypothetical protein